MCGLVDRVLRSGKVSDVGLALDSRTQPLIKLLPEGEFLVSAQEKVSAFFKLDGGEVFKSTVNWAHVPEVVGACVRACVRVLAWHPLLCHADPMVSPL